MIKVLMCCSTLDTKGGMVSVVKNYLDYDQWDNIKITFVPTHFDTNKYLLILYFAVRFLQIWCAVTFMHYDIAHLHVAERGSFWRKRFLMRFFHRHGIKVVLHHHGAEFEDFFANCNENQKRKIIETLNEADVNIVLSERLISMIKSKAPLSKVEVLYNAVKTYPNNPYSLSARNVLFLGRLGERKGVFDLLKAIKRIDQIIPEEVMFYLCGDMGEEVVENRVKEFGISHRIGRVGWIDGEKKQEILRNTMINCLPSYHEGLPMTILETMALGIPNISTNIASIPEVIQNGKNGFLIQAGDVTTLSERLSQLINNDALRLLLSKESFDLIRSKFSLEEHVHKLKMIYAQCFNDA